MSGYHLSKDLTDKAIEVASGMYVAELGTRTSLGSRYFAPGANHAPHQVPKEWADRYRGKFLYGLSALPRNHARKQKHGVVPANTELSPINPWPAPGSIPAG